MKPNKRDRLNIRVRIKWLKNLRSACRLSGLSQSDFVERAVDIYIEEHWHDLQPEPIEVVK